MDSQGDMSVCAVLVLYRPERQVVDNINLILPQCDRLAIIDNGFGEAIRALASHDKIEWITNDCNNLARAQNRGIAAARQAGCAFVLLLDQDSSPAPDMVAQLLKAYHRQAEGLAVIGPAIHDPQTRRPHDIIEPAGLGYRRIRPQEGQVYENILWLIASGSLIPLAVIARIGAMDEDYIIDYVDKEFCLRAVAAGYRVALAADARLTHRLGARRDHRLAGITLTATHHSAARRYTIYRNRLHTLRRYGFRVRGLLAYEILAIGYDLLRIVLCEEEKCAKLAAAARGAWAAFKPLPLGRRTTGE